MTVPGDSPAIDRRALVERHAVEVRRIDGQSPLSVGNGEFAVTVDVTGLQTLPGSYPLGAPGSTGTLLATMAQWGWHSAPPDGPGSAYPLARRAYPTPRGPVEYVDLDAAVAGTDDSAGSVAETWLRANPHRLDLARIGFAGVASAGVHPDELSDVHQRLDLWSGTIVSRYRLRGTPVRVATVCHPHRDVLALRVESGLLAAGLAIRITFPYGSAAWNDAADWSRPEAHTTTLSQVRAGRAAGGRGAGWVVERTLDDTVYTVTLAPRDGRVTQVGRHELLVTAGGDRLELVIGFHSGPPDGPAGALPAFAGTVAAARRYWAEFWTGGAAVELAASPDPRAGELERRIVLSRYLTAIHCAGSLPPQETGLMVNSWRGRFHLEMHWWHAAHFALWGQAGLLERSLGWYTRILPAARATARRQRCAGARWPKQVGPDGRESPSPIGPFLVWQQPHPIYLAELVRRAAGARRSAEVVERYAELVLDSAAFMVDYVVPGPRGYQLGPPLVAAQESLWPQRAISSNPTFELAYWAWALRVAQRWRIRLGLAPSARWEQVARGMARPTVRGGRYAALDVPAQTPLDDHPSMLYALGFVPPTGLIDPVVMRATLHHVLERWRWETTWGWDYPAMAMTAVRLGEPETALRALLLPVEKNTYLPNGHNRQSAELPVYLPGNGGLLAAVALMAAGAGAGAGRAAGAGPGARTGPGAGAGRAARAGRAVPPGFPDDGRWVVRHEGLSPLP